MTQILPLPSFLGCFIWMRRHCVLIGFHSWPTFLPVRPQLPCCASPVMCPIVQWRREEGRCIPEFADWIVAPSLITLLFGSAKVSPTYSFQPVTPPPPISKCPPTPLFYISFDCRQGVLFTNTSAHLFIFIQMDGLSSLRFGRAVRRFTYL